MKSLVRPLVFLLPILAWAGTPLTLSSMRLAFEVPAGWMLDDADAETLNLVQLYGPWTRNLQHPKITLYYYPKDSQYKSKEDYLKPLLNKKKKGGQEERVATLEDAKVGEHAAKRVTLSYVDTLGGYSTDLHREPVKETLVLFDAPQGGFYVFQYWAAQAIFKTNYPAFELLLASARPTTPEPLSRQASR